VLPLLLALAALEPPIEEPVAPVVPPVVAPAAPVDSRDLGPAELPPTRLRYDIAAKLLPAERVVEGELTLVWENPTGAPVDAVPLHLYLNAFESEATTWVRGSNALRQFSFDRYVDAYDDPFGWIDLTRVEQVTSAGPREAEHRFIQPNDGNPFDRSLAEVKLPAPVEPGGALTLRITFRSRLPVTIARTGGVDDWFHVGQWFPKIGVWDPPGVRGSQVGGWAARQFHGPTEFYADFADWTVDLDVPAGWSVVATGRQRGQTVSDGGRDKLVFEQRAVHDFAWVAARDAYVETHRHDPEGPGGPVDITYFVPAGRDHDVPILRAAAETTFDVLGARVGPYPFDTMKVIAPPWRAQESMGMEYPTLVTAGPGDPLMDNLSLQDIGIQEQVTSHEIAHNYFQGLVANDEQQEAFLDEGFTSYWEREIMEVIANERGGFQAFGHLFDWEAMVSSRSAERAAKLRESALKRPANLFYPRSHGTQIYTRSAITFTTARRRFGQAAVDRVFSTYFQRHRFRHPTSDDFFAVLDEVGPPELARFVREALTADELPDYFVDVAESDPWEPPVGWGHDGAERLRMDDEALDDARRRALALDPAWADADEGVFLLVTDPGHVAGGAVTPGGVRRERRPVTRGDAREGFEREDDELWRTVVRLGGPGWRDLPVDIRLRFADGVTLVYPWDGRGKWLELQLVRPAPLDEVLVDPDNKLAVDVVVHNDGVRLEPEPAQGSTWAGLVTRAAQWLAMGVSWWL
jgi:hypothetical protein